MLIQSPKHTLADIEAWRDLETADLLHGGLKSERIARLVDQSLAAIAAFDKAGPCYASVSWGKDSVVLAHLVYLHKLATGRTIPLVNLRIHPTRNPDCDAARDAFLDQYKLPYHEEPVDYSAVDPSLPTIEWDKQTYKLWDAAWVRVGERFGDRHLSGVRADESFVRLMRMAVNGWNTKRTSAPLGWWTLPDVFAWLAANRLPTHPAYAMLGGGRWPREHIRVSEIGDEKGIGHGRREWEREYYGDVLRRLEAGRMAAK